MKTYPITAKEVGRKGDVVTIKYSDGRPHRVRGPFQGSSELIEIDLGDILNRENIESARRPYQPGDWRDA